jgi:hypothetical protein
MFFVLYQDVEHSVAKSTTICLDFLDVFCRWARAHPGRLLLARAMRPDQSPAQRPGRSRKPRPGSAPRSRRTRHAAPQQAHLVPVRDGSVSRSTPALTCARYPLLIRAKLAAKGAWWPDAPQHLRPRRALLVAVSAAERLNRSPPGVCLRPMPAAPWPTGIEAAPRGSSARGLRPAWVARRHLVAERSAVSPRLTRCR